MNAQPTTTTNCNHTRCGVYSAAPPIPGQQLSRPSTLHTTCLSLFKHFDTIYTSDSCWSLCAGRTSNPFAGHPHAAPLLRQDNGVNTPNVLHFEHRQIYPIVTSKSSIELHVGIFWTGVVIRRPRTSSFASPRLLEGLWRQDEQSERGRHISWKLVACLEEQHCLEFNRRRANATLAPWQA